MRRAPLRHGLASALVLLALGAASCDPPPRAAALPRGGTPDGAERAATGSVTGKVLLAGGTWNRAVTIPAEQRPRSTDVPETWPWRTVFEDGGIPWVVVHVVEGPAQPAAQASSPALVEMRGAVLRPPILVVSPGGAVRVTNADAQPCAPRATAATRHDLTAGKGPLAPGASVDFRVGPADAPVRVSDGERPWLESWVLAFEHGGVAVTTVDGSFAIEGLPPGRYRLRVTRPSTERGPVQPTEFEADVRAGEVAWRVVEVKPAD